MQTVKTQALPAVFHGNRKNNKQATMPTKPGFPCSVLNDENMQRLSSMNAARRELSGMGYRIIGEQLHNPRFNTAVLYISGCYAGTIAPLMGRLSGLGWLNLKGQQFRTGYLNGVVIAWEELELC